LKIRNKSPFPLPFGRFPIVRRGFIRIDSGVFGNTKKITGQIDLLTKNLNFHTENSPEYKAFEVTDSALPGIFVPAHR
jgi:hypothetical protein